ncbi:MAG: helix-turn-helix transcriptional regulator [Prevotella sp.]|nr:helix-turn-helix transcriptional regulator [Prevotella sp.]MDE7089020.1 helix-turn-helix transcriptional regulator [Prevotella sp.]
MTIENTKKTIGVSRQTIFAIENNKFVPSTELALKLSAFFGKTVNELFWLTEQS